jgi:DHA3 family macrolide efflux protein-like MFS transporter
MKEVRSYMSNENKWKKRMYLFLLSQFVSMFGTQTVQYSITWYITMETGKGSNLALSTICGFLPMALVTPLGGIWADRFNRKRMIMFSDGSIAMVTLCLAGVLTLLQLKGAAVLVAIYIVSVIRSVGQGIQSPAVSAIIPQIVPKEELTRINSLYMIVYSVQSILAPVLSAAILSYSSLIEVLYIDVVTAAIGISIFSFIRVSVHEKSTEKKKTSYIEDFKEGMRYSFSSAFMKCYFIMYGAFSFFMVIPSILNVLLIKKVFGDNYLYLTLNEVFFFVGCVLGGLVLSKWGGFKNHIKTLIAGFFIFGITSSLIGVVDILWLYLVIIFVCGLGTPLFNTMSMTILQEKVKDENLLGRVFGFVTILSTVTMPFAIAIFGPLADIIDIRIMMVVSGALIFGIGIYCRLAKAFYYNLD